MTNMDDLHALAHGLATAARRGELAHESTETLADMRARLRRAAVETVGGLGPLVRLARDVETASDAIESEIARREQPPLWERVELPCEARVVEGDAAPRYVPCGRESWYCEVARGPVGTPPWRPLCASHVRGSRTGREMTYRERRAMIAERDREAAR